MSTKVILKGKKVILRPLSLNDAPNFCNWLNDPEVTKFLSIHHLPKPSLKEEREWISKAKLRKNNLNLAVDTAEGIHIGSISLEKIDKFNKHAEFGIMIGDKKYWGQGYGTEAGKLMVDYGFKKLKLHRIYLYIIAYNIRAQKSYEKLGFRLEGSYRQHWMVEGNFHDRVVMGLLRDEYLKKKK